MASHEDEGIPYAHGGDSEMTWSQNERICLGFDVRTSTRYNSCASIEHVASQFKIAN